MRLPNVNGAGQGARDPPLQAGPAPPLLPHQSTSCYSTWPGLGGKGPWKGGGSTTSVLPAPPNPALQNGGPIPGGWLLSHRERWGGTALTVLAQERPRGPGGGIRPGAR